MKRHTWIALGLMCFVNTGVGYIWWQGMVAKDELKELRATHGTPSPPDPVEEHPFIVAGTSGTSGDIDLTFDDASTTWEITPGAILPKDYDHTRKWVESLLADLESRGIVLADDDAAANPHLDFYFLDLDYEKRARYLRTLDIDELKALVGLGPLAMTLADERDSSHMGHVISQIKTDSAALWTRLAPHLPDHWPGRIVVGAVASALGTLALGMATWWRRKTWGGVKWIVGLPWRGARGAWAMVAGLFGADELERMRDLQRHEWEMGIGQRAGDRVVALDRIDRERDERVGRREDDEWWALRNADGTLKEDGTEAERLRLEGVKYVKERLAEKAARGKTLPGFSDAPGVYLRGRQLKVGMRIEVKEDPNEAYEVTHSANEWGSVRVFLAGHNGVDPGGARFISADELVKELGPVMEAGGEKPKGVTITQRVLASTLRAGDVVKFGDHTYRVDRGTTHTLAGKATRFDPDCNDYDSIVFQEGEYVDRLISRHPSSRPETPAEMTERYRKEFGLGDGEAVRPVTEKMAVDQVPAKSFFFYDDAIHRLVGQRGESVIVRKGFDRHLGQPIFLMAGSVAHLIVRCRENNGKLETVERRWAAANEIEAREKEFRENFDERLNRAEAQVELHNANPPLIVQGAIEYDDAFARRVKRRDREWKAHEYAKSLRRGGVTDQLAAISYAYHGLAPLGGVIPGKGPVKGITS